MVSIQLQDNNAPFRHICGASIVNEIFVITAAHCIVNVDISNIQLVFGSTNLDMVNEKRLVKKTYVHPMYHPRYFYYDVALLELDEQLQFGPLIRPVCIPIIPVSDVDSRKQNSAILTGWREIRPGFGSVLRQILMKVFSQTFCNSTRIGEIQDEDSNDDDVNLIPIALNDDILDLVDNDDLGYDQNGNPTSSSAKLPKLFKSDLICAGYEAGPGGKTSCPGDSGGPLVVFDSIRLCYTQIGVATGGHCGSTKYHGAFTRLEDPQVLDFIYRYAFGRTIINIGMLKFYKII